MPLVMSAPTTTSNSRETAARIVYQWRAHGDMPSRILDANLDDRAFVTEMVLGVVRHQLSLEWVIHKLAKRKPDDALMPVLSIGLYQLLILDHVEPYAAVHETVEAAKTLCGEKKSGFVNAILRRALREKDDLLKQLKKQPLHVRASHPRDLVQRWENRYGKQDTTRLCEWNNQRPDLIVRLRPTISAEGFLSALQSAGFPATPHERDNCFVLPPGCHVENCPGYAEGWFVVQDPATMAAVDLLDPQPGERMLDACAAPGGKTIAMADRMKQEGDLIACDINATRVKRLTDNLQRCGLKHATTRTINALELAPDTLGIKPFDAILLDVPCSNTGVIRRRPDARYRINASHLSQLQELQRDLLDRVTALLRPGGRIVYSTCSLEPEENEEQVAAWLQSHKTFRLDRDLHCFPPRDHTDGAYAARLVSR